MMDCWMCDSSGEETGAREAAADRKLAASGAEAAAEAAAGRGAGVQRLYATAMWLLCRTILVASVIAHSHCIAFSCTCHEKCCFVGQAGADGTAAHRAESPAVGLCVHLAFTQQLSAQHVGRLLSSQDIARQGMTLPGQVDIVTASWHDSNEPQLSRTGCRHTACLGPGLAT